MQAYIGKCIDSLLIPELDLVEIIVVNDGSKDDSLKIAQEYQKRYPQSIQIIDKPNGNYGSCINAALPTVTGRYVKILDADDTFDTNEFSKFVSELVYCDEDVLFTNFRTVSDFGEIRSARSLKNYFEQEITVDSEIVESIKNIPMYALTYNVNIFKRFNYKQTEGISYTDTQWAIIPLSFCETCRYIDIFSYNYLVGREGQTMNADNLKKNLGHFIRISQDILLFSQTIENKQIKSRLFSRFLVYQEFMYFQFLSNLNRDTMQMLKDYDTNLKTLYPNLYEAIGKIPYSSFVKFPVFSDVRQKNYPSDYKVPFRVLCELSLKVKFDSFKKSMQHILKLK